MDIKALSLVIVMVSMAGCHAGGTRDAAVERALAWAIDANYLTARDELCFGGQIRVVGPTTLLSVGDCAIKVTTDEDLRSVDVSPTEPLPFIRVGAVKQLTPDHWLVDLELNYVPPAKQKGPIFGGVAWVRCEVRRSSLGWRVRALKGVIS